MLSGKKIDRRKAVRVLTNGKFPGALLLAENRAHIDATSIDVSRMGIGFVSTAHLSTGTSIILKTKRRDVRLTIVTAIEQPASDLRRYGLLIDDDFDLEAAFKQGNCLINSNVAGKETVQRTAPRFAIHQDLKLRMQTLGTLAYYNLTIENLSQSGLLVATSQSDALPFRVNTLVEMVIDPDSTAFIVPIRATGKIVRRMDSSAKQHLVRLGLAVVDIEPEHQVAWTSALEALEQSAG